MQIETRTDGTIFKLDWVAPMLLPHKVPSPVSSGLPLGPYPCSLVSIQLYPSSEGGGGLYPILA